jgi:hypothetical protein
LAVAVTLSSGCSAIFVNKPASSRPPGAPVTCTDSRVVPGVDTVLTALFLAGTIATAETDCQEAGCIVDLGIGGLLGSLTITYGISALWGHDAVTTCRELKGPRPPPLLSAPLAGPPPQPGWKPMVVGTTEIEVHSGTADAAPIIARLPPGTTMSVRDGGVEGWVLVRLPDGRAGYARNW